jgi:hypothetical protein
MSRHEESLRKVRAKQLTALYYTSAPLERNWHAHFPGTIGSVDPIHT